MFKFFRVSTNSSYFLKISVKSKKRSARARIPAFPDNIGEEQIKKNLDARRMMS